MKSLRDPCNPLHIPLGLLLFGLWLSVARGSLALACRALPPQTGQGAMTGLNLGLGLFSSATLLGLLGLAWRYRRAASQQPRRQLRRRLLASLSAAVHLLAAIATAVLTLPLVMLPPCL